MTFNEYKFIETALKQARKYHDQKVVEIDAKLLRLNEALNPVTIASESPLLLQNGEAV